MHRITRVVVLAALALSALPAMASAHIGASPETTGAGEYALTRFGVSHGCEEAGTTSLEIKFQDDLTSVTPYVNPNWTFVKKMRKLDKPLDAGHGESVSEVVDTITWTKTGAALPGDVGDNLYMSIKLDGEAGDTLYFPTVQKCEGGKETGWIQIPEEGESGEELESPSPSITLTAASGGHGGGGDDKDEAEDTDEGGAFVTDAHVHKHLDKLQVMSFIAILLGALGLIMALLGFRGRSKENRNR